MIFEEEKSWIFDLPESPVWHFCTAEKGNFGFE